MSQNFTRAHIAMAVLAASTFATPIAGLRRFVAPVFVMPPASFGSFGGFGPATYRRPGGPRKIAWDKRDARKARNRARHKAHCR